MKPLQSNCETHPIVSSFPKINSFSHLVTCSSLKNELGIYDLDKQSWISKLDKKSSHSSGVFALTTYHGKLVSVSRDNSVKIWDLTSGKCVRTLRETTANINCLKLLDKDRFGCGLSNKLIRIWDIKSGSCVLTLKGHDDSINCVEQLDNGDLVTGADDASIRSRFLKLF